MANFRYVTPNQLRAQVSRHRRLLIYTGLPGTFGTFAIHPMLGILSAVALVALWNRSGRHLYGAVGEEWALGHPVVQPGSLANLPAHYIVFNNLVVPTGHGGTRELDLVVLGRNGLFVIEAKHLRGEISGAESDHEWRQVKRSRRSGTAFTTRVRNPVTQVRSATRVLHRYLAARGINVWAQGVVVFTHSDVVLRVSAGSLPVVRLPELAGVIESYPVSRPPRPFVEVVEALKGLRTGVPVEREAGLQHVSIFMRDFVTREERLSGLGSGNRQRLKKAVRALARFPVRRSSSLPIPMPAPEYVARPTLPVQPSGSAQTPEDITLIHRVTTVLRRRTGIR